MKANAEQPILEHLNGQAGVFRAADCVSGETKFFL